MQVAQELENAQGQLEKAEQLIGHLMDMARAYQAELGRPLAPPPEVIHAMSVTSSGMRPILMDVGGRPIVVAPPEGFDNPYETWRNIVGHYGKRED
jgi:hypothetical protein